MRKLERDQTLVPQAETMGESNKEETQKRNSN